MAKTILETEEGIEEEEELIVEEEELDNGVQLD